MNDMRPYCEHQKALGWDKLATKKVTLYNYTLRYEWVATQRKLHGEVNKILGETGQIFLTEDEREVWNLPLSVHTWKPLDDMRYEPQKKQRWNDGPTEEKALGWLSPEEHPEGILGKPCPVCGYKYGTAWQTEEVPEEVLQSLYNLPNTTKQPAWV